MSRTEEGLRLTVVVTVVIAVFLSRVAAVGLLGQLRPEVLLHEVLI